MPHWFYILLIFGTILALSGFFVAYKNRRETRLARESDSLSDWLVWGSGVLGLAVELGKDGGCGRPVKTSVVIEESNAHSIRARRASGRSLGKTV